MHHSSASTYRGRITAAILVIAGLIAAPLVAATTAQAASGYVGVSSNGPWADGTLATMTTGTLYEDYLEAAPGNGGYSGWDLTTLPAGLSWEVVGGSGPRVKISGTPTSGGPLNLVVSVSGADGWSSTLSFSGTVVSPLAATTTSLVGRVAGPLYTPGLIATVTGTNLTGKVQFYADGTAIGIPENLYDDIAYFQQSLDYSRLGTTPVFTARYLGDSANAASASGPVSTFIYSQGYVYGYLFDNGRLVVGATVELLLAPATASDTPVDTKTSGSAGNYTFMPSITSEADARKTYVIRATFPDGGPTLYYKAGSYLGTPNFTDIADADATGPMGWVNMGYSMYFNTPPTWSDESLADFRKGSVYSDGVTAVGTGIDYYGQSNTLAYSVSAGLLPAGITLDTATGALSGTPANDTAYDFTIRAANLYGSITSRFTGTPLPAGVAPVWSDTTLGTLQKGVTFTDAVHATGDASIAYTVTAGTLPAGLALNAATGAITGAPTGSGAFSFEVSATNTFGSVTHIFTGTIMVDPEIALELKFTAGSEATGATTDISASDLMVGSTYTLVLHSDPILLLTATVDASGGFSFPVSLPAGIPAGAHSLILTGIGVNGQTMTATAWFSIDANGRIVEVSMTGPVADPRLASTGVEIGNTVLIAFSLVMAGLILSAARRRRSLV